MEIRKPLMGFDEYKGKAPIENPGGIPDRLSSKLHWVNSSNVLCNYMKKQE